MQISTSVCTNYNKLKVVRKILLNKIEIIFNFFICFCVEPLSISPTSQLLLVTPPPLLFHSIFFGSPPPPLLKCHFFFSCPPPPPNPTSPPHAHKKWTVPKSKCFLHLLFPVRAILCCIYTSGVLCARRCQLRVLSVVSSRRTLAGVGGLRRREIVEPEITDVLQETFVFIWNVCMWTYNTFIFCTCTQNYLCHRQMCKTVQ